MPSFHQTQAQFMDLCGLPRYTLRQIILEKMLTNPTFIHQVLLWHRLIQEEVNAELNNTLSIFMQTGTIQYALQDESERIKLVTKIADDIVDSVYVIDGLSNLFGLPRAEIFAEIHRSNMAKAHKLPSGQTVIRRRADGKILKPEGWEPPKIQSIIEAHISIP